MTNTPCPTCLRLKGHAANCQSSNPAGSGGIGNWQAPANESEWGALPSTDPRKPAPVGKLPEVLAEYCRSLAEYAQVPEDFALAGVLATLSGASRGRWRVHYPNPNPHTEPLALYVALFAPPGERKSSVLGAVTLPLREWEWQRTEATAAQVARDREYRALLEARVEKARRAASDPSAPAERVAEWDGATGELAAFIPAKETRVSVQDVTMERLAALLAEYDESLFLSSAEGGIFATIGGRYSNGVVNLDLVNSAYDSEQVIVDRQGKDSLHLRQPFLAQLLAVQPDVLREITAQREIVRRGYLDRFALVLPESRLGTRTLKVAPIPGAISDGWNSAVRGILEAATEHLQADRVAALQLEAKAGELFTERWHELEPRLGPEGNLAGISGWASKLPGRVLRIAALLTLATDPNARTVSVEAMGAAWCIGSWLLGHARYALNRDGIQSAETRATLKAVGQMPHDTFTTRDLYRQVSGQRWVSSADLVREQLQVLEALRHIRKVPATDGKPGRPTELWERRPK